MRKITAAEFSSRYDALPEELQNAIYSPDTKSAIRQIAASQQLHLDQLEQLDYAVALVMLGVIAPENFIKEIEDGVRIPHENARSLTTLINEKIFLPIRELMREAPVLSTVMPPPTIPAHVTPHNDTPDRASVLKEIENPAVSSPQFIATSSTPIIVSIATPLSPQQESAGGIAEQKLTQPTSSAIEETTVGRDRSSYKVDPYREPVE